MIVTKEIEAEIQRLHQAERWPIGTICQQLGLHRDTVLRVLGGHSSNKTLKRQPRLLVPYMAFIEETLRIYPRLRATRLFDMLRARGYTGSTRTLRYYVSEVRPRETTMAYARLQPLVAEQAQVDWAHVGRIQVDGGERALWVFVMVFSYSRALWAELVLDLTAASLRRSLIRAAQFFGGCTRQWLFDNPKIVVLERHGEAIRFHPELLDVASRFCVQPRVCGIRKPQHKGRVERAVRYLRDRFFAGRRIVDIEQGNRELQHFMQTVAMQRRHPDLHANTVAQVLEQEQQHLLALPSPLPQLETVTPAIADKTAFVRFDTNLYSVPPAFAQRMLSVAADDINVRFLQSDKEIASHRRCWGKRQKKHLPQHLKQLIEQRRSLAQHVECERLRNVVSGIDQLFERWLRAGRNMRSMTAQVLRLLDLYGETVFAAAAADILQATTHDLGALALRCEAHRRRLKQPILHDAQLPEHARDWSVIQHDLENYDG